MELFDSPSPVPFTLPGGLSFRFSISCDDSEWNLYDPLVNFLRWVALLTDSVRDTAEASPSPLCDRRTTHFFFQ